MVKNVLGKKNYIRIKKKVKIAVIDLPISNVYLNQIILYMYEKVVSQKLTTFLVQGIYNTSQSMRN